LFDPAVLDEISRMKEKNIVVERTFIHEYSICSFCPHR
jgi:hypothetical protein